MAQFYSRVGNFAAIGWCSFGVALIGVIFMVAGAIITGIAYTEITPPNYDDNYHRYLGSSVPRLVGKKYVCIEKRANKNMRHEIGMKAKVLNYNASCFSYLSTKQPLGPMFSAPLRDFTKLTNPCFNAYVNYYNCLHYVVLSATTKAGKNKSDPWGSAKSFNI